MKILYAIQGTGNGHIARAHEVIPHLKRFGNVDILVSGIQSDIQLPWPVRYQFYGLSFIFGTNGGVDIRSTIGRSRPLNLIREIMRLPVHEYDLVLNDFEPVSAWACKLKNKKCIAISHQSAVLHPQAPVPEVSDSLGKGILRYYAPVQWSYGFHFDKLDESINTPVVRSDIRNAAFSNQGHYAVYLPSYSDEKIIEVLTRVPYIQWDVYSKHNREALEVKNVKIQRVDKQKFTQSFLNCAGIICNAGFETPAEALYMGKKLCVIPMKGQYEQQCNAAFLKNMGVRVINDFEKEVPALSEWVFYDKALKIHYPDNLEEVIERIIFKHAPYLDPLPHLAISNQFKML